MMTQGRAQAAPVAAAKKITLLPLIAATYFMVAGGPYGIEDLVGQAGYGMAIFVLLVTPIIWSLPTALMVGELSSALPEDGGYYAWVRRALGPFWGFMEAWLSLVASIFDMALYPTLFVLYLSRLVPGAGGPGMQLLLGAGLIALCAGWNLRGANAVGGGALLMSLLLLGPFAVLVLLAFTAPAVAPVMPASLPSGSGPLAGVLVAMWNYMGWDNASTIAAEVDRPQRTYPLAMITTVGLVALCYVLPVLALERAGVDATKLTAGSWVAVAGLLGGRWLATFVVVGGVVAAVGTFNALMMSYSRLPVALAHDGFLPAVFARRHPRTGAPSVAIIACAIAYASVLRLGFARLVQLDVLFYGLSLILEFAALVALRVREPGLARPFRVPGGLIGAALVGVPPTLLIIAALAGGAEERVGPLRTSTFAGLVIALGVVLYAIARRLRSPAEVDQGIAGSV